MLPNPILLEQLARDKQAEIRDYLHDHPTAPRSLRLAWLAGFFALILAGATFVVR
jgi:hypothetical protein